VIKKALATTAGICIGILVAAQQFGVSGHGIVWMQRAQEKEIDVGNTTRMVKTYASPTPGFRVELNYILPGYAFPVSGYNGIGLTYIAPSTDSTYYYARSASGFGGQTGILGTKKTSILSIGLRFGYEIPQEFNDFLLLHAGLGFSYCRFTSQNILPEQSATFNHTAADFDPETFEKVSDGGMGIEVFVGGVYEFEKFSVLGQYSLMVPWGGIESKPGIRHGPSIGIFYTLADLR
jgi:hypothetical protein